MPTFDISTNVKEVPAKALTELTQLSSKILGKDEKYICVHIKPNQMMSFGGDAVTPCAVVYLSSIGKLGGELNKPLVTAITDYLNKEMRIPPDRMYINFVDQVKTELGWNAKTFDIWLP